jgi:biopolymer transport protein TolR
MGMSQGGDSEVMSEINVTPFVDVMLVLLIIFMVTAPMMTQGMQVELPKTDAPPLPSAEDQMTLSITAEGSYYINEREFTLDELQQKLAALSKVNPDQEVFLRADGQVPYEKVAELMSVCTLAGITKLGMVTQPGTDHSEND